MIRIDLPPDIEEALRESVDNLDQAAKEAALVELYRQGKLTHYQLSQALGLSRYETDGLLKAHGVPYDLSQEDFSRQVQSLRAEAGR